MSNELINYGCRVRLVLRSGEITLRNVTEIHYVHNLADPSVAFESDIHGTGRNERLSDVLEFETSLESSVADDF